MRLKGTGIKRETESLIPAAQEQAIRKILLRPRLTTNRKKANFECVEMRMKHSIISSLNVACCPEKV